MTNLNQSSSSTDSLNERQEELHQKMEDALLAILYMNQLVLIWIWLEMLHKIRLDR